ncbi:MAG: hypothetical protein KC478_01485 [Bacteriovoracaceae bacterium]|nr:hypothetical protein [Bacteriovoracaceae bacterium]
MLKNLFIAIIALSATTSIAKANTLHMDHGELKNMVRMSLWYEGTTNFESSAFRPGAAFEMLAQSEAAQEDTVELSEELAVALENITF